MQRVDKGLILRETAYRDSDVMLTVLTECGGKLSVLARGVRRKSSRMSAAVSFLSYSEFTFFESGGRYTLNEAEPIELFYNLRNDIRKLSLASYFAEALEQASEEESINPELLRLGLNALYALANTKIEPNQIKAVFELKIAALSGYMPDVGGCRMCGAKDVRFFDIANGGVVCGCCAEQTLSEIDGSVLDAMRFILYGDIKRIFSFTIGETAISRLGQISEVYLRTHFDRSFKTLAFYKSLI